MANTLEHFIQSVRTDWGPLTSEFAEHCRMQLEMLLRAPIQEPWLAELLNTAPLSQELYRDPEHGFVLLAHTERAGLYRPPHDHGRSWVIYGMQHGSIELGTFARITEPGEEVRLVKRNAAPMQAGQAQVYLPGDIHDTRCASETALLFRFTERDLKLEDQRDHCVTRYTQKNGVWTIGAP